MANRAGSGGFYSDYESRVKARIREKRRRTLIRGAAVIAAAVLIGLWLFKGCGKDDTLAPLESYAPVQTVTATVAPTATATAEPVYEGMEQRFFYMRLAPEYQSLYLRLRDGLASHAEEIGGIEVADVQSLLDIYKYVYLDYPEYFWVSGGSTTSWTEQNGMCRVDIFPGYNYSVSECVTYASQIEAEIADILMTLDGKSDYEKVKGVYEYLINTTQYDLDYHGKTMYELFTAKRAVCDGYARAAQYLLTRLGVETLFVTGSADNGESTQTHTWNMVKLGGSYYQMDVTWGDPVSSDGEQNLRYDYLCITDGEMLLTHTPDEDYYPSCSATEYNYYVQEGRLLYSYDEQTLGEWMLNAYEQGVPLSFKAADESVFAETYSQLIDGDRVFDIMRGINGIRLQSITHDSSEALRTMIICF